MARGQQEATAGLRAMAWATGYGLGYGLRAMAWAMAWATGYGLGYGLGPTGYALCAILCAFRIVFCQVLHDEAHQSTHPKCVRRPRLALWIIAVIMVGWINAVHCQ